MPTSRPIVLAFDSFKGSLTATQACRAAAAGAGRAGVASIECPLSDGGEGFVEAVCLAGAGSIERFDVTGPLFQTISAEVGLLDAGRTAIVEAAQVCGPAQVPAELRSPLRTTSRGLGELLRLLAQRVDRVIVGLGGTATNDCGIGMLSALGWKFFDSMGTEPAPVGASLVAIDRVEPGSRLSELEIVAACDVQIPLFGPQGAAYVYSPQKGAGPGEVELLDRGLRQVSDLMSAGRARRPGSGAAGGLGFALSACLGARIESGAEFAIHISDLPKRLLGAGLCLTGEGRTDSQTLSGKLPVAVARECLEARVRCVCISGSVGPGWEGLLEEGCAAVVPLARDDEDAGRSCAEAKNRLADAAERIARVYMAGGESR